jgi:hydrogenase large subunit
MSWDPITRIVGSLGIYTKIDFANREVVECHSTSSIFRGYSVFMKGKDPRDAHFITSRICGICGDNHATCAVYAQNMAYGVRPPPLGEWIINLGEAAEYMFDHNIFQDNLVGVDFCEQMVKETNPGVLEQGRTTEAPHATIHGYRTIADIMRAQPVRGRVLPRGAADEPLTREMFCLMEGRHVHPSTLYPGGVGTVASRAALHRLPRAADEVRRVHEEGRAAARRPVRLLLRGAARLREGRQAAHPARLLGRVPGSRVCDYTYENMTDWGRAMFVTPASCRRRAGHDDLVDINLGIRILLGSSFYDDWERRRRCSSHDPLGNPVDQRHPWNQTRSRSRRSATSTATTAG